MNTQSILDRYEKGLISSADAQHKLGLATKDAFFSSVVASGRSIYHVDREVADVMAETALRLSGLKE